MDKTIIKDWTIYKIINPNGRVYIGKTYSLKNRIKQYKHPSHPQQRLIYRSLKKYGFENHDFSVIDTFTSDSTYASGKEIFWIRTYMSNYSQYPFINGMNLTNGGEGAPGAKHSEERKKQLSDFFKGNKYNLGRKQPLEERLKRGVSLTGKKRSPETLLRLKEAATRLRYKPVLKLDLHGNVLAEFANMKIAAEALDITRDTLRSIITSKTKKPNYCNRDYKLKFK